MRALKKIKLVGLSLIVGISISLQVSAKPEHETPATPLPVKELHAFTDVFGQIKRSYVEPVTDKQLFTDAIKGMLNGLDPHSAYLDEDSFKDLKVSTQGEFGGLGIEVGIENGLIKVISPIEDTPAYQAGVKSGDLIIKLDDTRVKGISFNDAIKRMRGKPGSKITLTILRKGEHKPLLITVVRAEIKVKSVKAKLLESGYAFIRITQFQERTGENLATSLKKLTKQNHGPLKGIVLDLRDDPGGLLDSAVAVSAVFLAPDALVVYTEGRTEEAKMHLTASPEYYLHEKTQKDYEKNIPASIKDVHLIVLVNGGSASASEIVAGALQDHKRAIIMGTQTFGKGSVQTVLPLDNRTAIKLTTARYYTPNGRSIQAKGIVPDIVVEDPASPGANNVFDLRESDLAKHLLNEKQADDSADFPAKTKSSPNKNSGNFKPIAFGSKSDYQLNQALNLLKGMQILQGK